MPDNNVASNQKYSLKIKKSFAKLFTAAQAFDDFFPLFFGAMTPGMVSSIPTRIRYGFPQTAPDNTLGHLKQNQEHFTKCILYELPHKELTKSCIGSEKLLLMFVLCHLQQHISVDSTTQFMIAVISCLIPRGQMSRL